MKMTKDEFAILLLRAAECDFTGDFLQIAKLLAIRRNTCGEIAFVLANCPDLIHQVIPAELIEILGLRAANEHQLSVAVESQLEVAEQIFGPISDQPAFAEYSELSFSEELIILYHEMSGFHAEFTYACSALYRDFEAFSPLTRKMLIEKSRRPIWDYEEFAIYSQGRVLHSGKTLLANEELGYVGTELKRRVSLMTDANMLPNDHRDHLPPVTSPRDLMDWAINGERFEIHSLLMEVFRRSNREELECSLSQANARIQELEEKLAQKRSSSSSKEDDSLQKLCIGLVACIRRHPIAGDRPLYKKKGGKSTFIGDLQTWMAQVLLPEDMLHQDTIRKYIELSFSKLSQGSRQSWIENKSAAKSDT